MAMTDATPPNPTSSDSDHAGVRIPPPTLFSVALLVGIALEWLWPLGWFDG
jgi:hypothetical protein